MRTLFNLFFITSVLWSCNPNADQVNKPIDKNTVEQTEEVSSDQKNETEQKELSDDKIQSLKVAYFTKELNLSQDEAEKFWPIYNKHTQIYQDLGDTEWDAIKKGLREVEQYNNLEAEELLERYKAYLNQRLTNRLVFIEELESVISPKKIMLLKHAEYNFNKKLLKQYRSGEATTK